MPSFLSDRKNLYDWLIKQPSKQFPQNTDYPSRLKVIFDYLSNNIYPQVGTGALLETLITGANPVYLNDHGVNHVIQVIERASLLVRQSKYDINAYEAYILVVAILLHDLGNIYGRDAHERKSGEIFNSLGAVLTNDTAEKRIIAKIAAAHGGKIGDSKDTIGTLQREFHLFGKCVNKQFIAAILRFADELADDRTRASRFFLDNQNLVPGSAIFHAYSDSLRSVNIAKHDISLQFEINKSKLLQQYPKGESHIYLVDEIFLRSLKMFTENIYCMRFLRPNIFIENLRFTINFFDDSFQNEIHEPVSYFLRENGYPVLTSNNIVSFCPNLEGISGNSIAEQLQQ